MKRALLFAVTVAACTRWDEVKTSYCSHHPGTGDCLASSGGGAGGGAGGGMGAAFDGGPPVDWARLLGGTRDDLVTGFAMDTAGTELALSGTFGNAIDLGNGVALSAGGSTQTATFAARLRPSDGGLVGGFAWRCGMNISAPEPAHFAPLVYTDGGLTMGSSCYYGEARIFDHTGAELFLDGGPHAQSPDLFLFRLTPSPVLRYFHTPDSYEPEKRIVAAAGDDQPFVLIAANAPRGAELLPMDAGIDAGSGPHLARYSVDDFTPQQVDLFQCPHNRVVEWESLALDKVSQRVFAVIRAAETPPGDGCFAYIPGGFAPSTAGTTNVGLHRFLFFIDAAGSQSTAAGLTIVADTTPDAGPLLLAPESDNSLYLAGTVTGYVASERFTTPTLAVWNMDVAMMRAAAFHAYRAGPGSRAELDDLAIVPGATPQIWVLGTVDGALQDVDGGAVLSSVDGESDGFLVRLNPTTLAPMQKLVFGNPGVSEHMVKLVVRPPWAYVAATATPAAGGGGPYTFGGQTLGSLDSRDVLVFRIALP